MKWKCEIQFQSANHQVDDMSKIPIDRNGKLRAIELRGLYSSNHSKIKSFGSLDSVDVKRVAEAAGHSQNAEIKPANDIKEQIFCKSYASLIPKMSLNLEKVVEQNPRILDLREKLNAITKKQDRNVDKKTKGFINDITQLVDDKEQDESGPYSLLFDLKPDSSTSCQESTENNVWNRPKSGGVIDFSFQSMDKSNNPVTKSADRLPNVLNFDDKPMKEFEYSCEKEVNFPVKKVFNTHSRSDLCLQLKSHIIHSRTFESNLSPNDNSLSRTNEENSLDDSLGILTPDQMDDICYLENAFSPTVEGLPIFCDSNECKISPDNGDTPSTDKTESNSAASTIQNDGFENGESKKYNLFERPLAPIVSLEAITNEDQSASYDVPVGPKSQHNALSVPKESRVLSKFSQDLIAENENFDATKEDSIPNLIEEEFLPSIHSSILEPVSSIAETTVNLEIPLDCKHDKSSIVNRIDQTPSPEDLPLDSSDINGEMSTYSQFSASTLHDSNTYSDSKNDYPKSMETSKVSNSFITSITSITSLDGYQGDGEMSRPVSRGADHSIEQREDVIEMDWQNVPVTRRADPMTDSDFFTESDADGLDDHMQRGDRRAQVIDGALYGGKNANGNPPLLVNRNDDSCMESSGVYTDFENHRASPVFLNVIDDMSPEGSTPSTRSECSQKNASTGNLNAFFTSEDTLEESKVISQIVNDDETPKNTSKRNSINSEKDIRTTEKVKEEKRSFTLKKYKMPKRDVPSKLKSMLASRKTDADVSVQSSPKAVKKPDRRENLSKKNSLDIKSDYKIKSFKDIKSKVDCSFSLQRSQTSCSVSRMLSSKSTNTNPKPKSRHMRMRMELGSANGSGKSSLHSSQSDISATSTPLGKHPTSRFPLLRNGKKRDAVPTPTTPARPPATPPQPPPVQAKKNGVVQKLSSSPVTVRARTSLAPPPSPRKPPPHRVPAQRPTTLPTSKEPPRVATAVGPRGKRVQTPQPARTPSAPACPPPAPPCEQAAALAHAAKGVEALGVLVQYLVFRLDALNGGSWRLEAERWRGVAAAERSSAERADRDRQQRAQKDLDTIAECLSKISELEMEVSSKEEANARLQATHIEEVASLANDIKGLKNTIESLKHEVAESRARLHAHSEIERTLRAQLEAARAELERSPRAPDPAPSERRDKCTTCDAACDPVLCEVEDCELRLSANEELSTDATELAAEVSFNVEIESQILRVVELNTWAARAKFERSPRAPDPAPSERRDKCTTCDAACDPVLCEVEDYELRLSANEELSTDATELAAEVSFNVEIESQILRVVELNTWAARAKFERSPRAPDPAPSKRRDKCTTCDAACDPVLCEVEDCELRLSANEELSIDATELAAEVSFNVEIESQILRVVELNTWAARAKFERSPRAPDPAPSERRDKCTTCDAACDPVLCEVEDCELRLSANEELSTDATELAAEVRSLRAVIELKQAEMASLRDARSELSAERERRAAAERDALAARHVAEELRERAAARQRDVDRLRDDNRRLRDAAARDRDHAARLAALNEELRYKLRQKSQVVSLLAGGGYIERPPLRARTSSGDSARSASPPPDSPPSPASSPAPDTPPLPAVKGVVEKHDSVSWVLEIEETPEEVASRLARRSSFRTAGGASPSGVKRRGGGSPGSGSPAPASPAPNASKLFRPGDLDFPPPPPPLKESAGEAIYIYDDRQY